MPKKPTVRAERITRTWMDRHLTGLTSNTSAGCRTFTAWTKDGGYEGQTPRAAIDAALRAAEKKRGAKP